MTATTSPARPAGSPSSPALGALTAVSDGLVVAKRNLIKIKRVPDLLVFTTLQPIMFVLLFAYVFGGAIAVRGSNYKEFLMAGIFTQTVTFGATLTGAGLADDMKKASSTGSGRCRCRARPSWSAAPPATWPTTCWSW